MSEEKNLEIVRRATEALFSRPPDWDTVNALFDPAHVMVFQLSKVEGGSAVGAWGWRDWRARMDETGDWGIEADEIRPAPQGRVLLTGRFRLRGDRSGVAVENYLGAVITVREGRIVRTETFFNPNEALEAAGLSVVEDDPKGVIAAMYASFSQLAEDGDIEAHVATYYAADAEYHPVEEVTPIRGKDQLVRWHKRWFDVWDELEALGEEIAAKDATVVTAVSVRARGAGSGTEVHQAFFHVAEVRNRQIERLREYLDRREALRAAGLPPSEK